MSVVICEWAHGCDVISESICFRRKISWPTTRRVFWRTRPRWFCFSTWLMRASVEEIKYLCSGGKSMFSFSMCDSVQMFAFSSGISASASCTVSHAVILWLRQCLHWLIYPCVILAVRVYPRSQLSKISWVGGPCRSKQKLGRTTGSGISITTVSV